MKKPVTPTAHGLIDYATCGLLFAAPRLFGLSNPARKVSYALGAGYLLESAMTDYPPGLKREIPFRTHGKIDLMSAPLVLAAPFAAGAMRESRDRTYFLALLGMVLGVYALTNWRAWPIR